MLKRLMISGFVVCCIVGIGIGYSYGVSFTSSSTGSLTLGTLTIITGAQISIGYESTNDGVTYTVQTKHLQGDRRFAAEAEQQSIFYQAANVGETGMAGIGATEGNDINGWSIIGS